MRRIPRMESQTHKFFGGGSSFLAAFEVRDDGKTHLLGIVVDKKGEIKMGKLPPVRDVMLGHPQITHYELKCAVPEDKLAKVIQDAVHKMPDFNSGLLAKEYMFGNAKLTDIGEELAGTVKEDRGSRKLHLKMGKGSRVIRLKEEVSGEKGEYSIEYALTKRGLMIGIEINGTGLPEPISIEPRKMGEVKGSLREEIGSEEIVSKDKEKVEVSERIGEADVRYTFTKKMKITRIDIDDKRLPEPLTIMLRKVEKGFREFINGEEGQEWYAGEIEKKKRRKSELSSKRID